jgi:hypothetical protein
MVSAKDAEVVCCGVPESVNWNVIRDPDTASVGVPLITPVDEFRVDHAGNLPEVTFQV